MEGVIEYDRPRHAGLFGQRRRGRKLDALAQCAGTDRIERLAAQLRCEAGCTLPIKRDEQVLGKLVNSLAMKVDMFT